MSRQAVFHPYVPHAPGPVKPKPRQGRPRKPLILLKMWICCTDTPPALPVKHRQTNRDCQFALALDPAKARRLRAESGVDESHGACTMCGAFCAYKVMSERKAGAGG